MEEENTTTTNWTPWPSTELPFSDPQVLLRMLVFDSITVACICAAGEREKKIKRDVKKN